MPVVSSKLFLGLGLLAARALGETHRLYGGFLTGSETILSLEFDDAANTLTLVKNITATGSSAVPWLSFDSKKENVYILAGSDVFQSYSITEDLDLSFQKNVSFPSGCSTIFGYFTSSAESPYTAFGTPYATGCPSVAISVDANGTLDETLATATYDDDSGVHGTDLSADGAFLYSADDKGNAVWTHSWDGETNTFEALQRLNATDESNPRHLVAHPNGKWVYAVYEAGNAVAAYSRDTTTGLLTFTNTTYSLIPEGFTNGSSYEGDEIMFSTKDNDSPKYLYASTRCNNVGTPGYVAVYALDADTGAITSELMLLPTTNSGGGANAVSPAAFSEEYFAITDSGTDFIEVWKLSDDASGAEVVAHLDVDGGPANLIWYN